MVEIVQTGEFERWLRGLKDKRVQLRVVQRIDRLAAGNPGDARPVGKGLSELRLNFGPGYRIYYTQKGSRLVLLLCGGDKSTQRADIERAHLLAQEWRADKEHKEGRQ